MQQGAGVIQSTVAEVPEGTIRAMLFFFGLFGVQRRPEVLIRLSVDMLEEIVVSGCGFIFCFLCEG